MSLSVLNTDWSLIATTIKDFSNTSNKIVNLGRQFESQYLIVRINTRNQKDTWLYGGKIWASALIWGKQSKFYQVDLDLFEQELIIVPKLFEGKYSLLYEAPKYFLNVTIKVWEYRGTLPSTTLDNKIERNYQELLEVKALCNSILDNLGNNGTSNNPTPLQQQFFFIN